MQSGPPLPPFDLPPFELAAAIGVLHHVPRPDVPRALANLVGALKPGGVRIGTAEVYRFAETVAAVDDSLVIGDQIKVGKRAGGRRHRIHAANNDGRPRHACA